MVGTRPAVASPDPTTPMFYAQRMRQHRSLVTRFTRSTQWLLPEDLRDLAGILIEEAERRELAERRGAAV